MLSRPCEAIQQNYNKISALCKQTKKPLYLTNNGEDELVVMDIDAFVRREKMLELREALVSVEEDRLAGRKGCTPDKLEDYLGNVIDKVAQGEKI